MYQQENKLVDLTKAVTDTLHFALSLEMQVDIDVLRLDKIHPVLSGNKWFKLKYHLQEAKEKKYDGILSFGGAYSNHIVAASYAAAALSLDATGVIRGEAPSKLSHTLNTARSYGMQLHFISRAAYSNKETSSTVRSLIEAAGNCYIIPEGGAGALGVKGSEEILQLTEWKKYTHIICAMGTAAMFTGVAKSSLPGQQVIGIPVLKGFETATEQVLNVLDPDKRKNCLFFYDFHFGGYAKHTVRLINFMNRFYQDTGIPTDFVYTAKLFYGLCHLLEQQYFPAGSKVLVIHSGGLQGNHSLPPGSLLY